MCIPLSLAMSEVRDFRCALSTRAKCVLIGPVLGDGGLRRKRRGASAAVDHRYEMQISKNIRLE